MAVGKNILWGTREEDGNCWEESQDSENGGGEEYQVVGNFIHPYLCKYLYAFNGIWSLLVIKYLTLYLRIDDSIKK